MTAYHERPVEQRIAILEAVPIELRQQPQWVGFQLKSNGDKLDKLPRIAPQGRCNAKSNDPKTWCDFNTAVTGLRLGRYNAVGYALSGNVFAIDLDHCLDPQPSAFAVQIMASIRTYTEISASGRGLHLFGVGQIHRSIRTNSLELYGDKRFIVVTGERFGTTPLELSGFSADELDEAIECDGSVVREIGEKAAIASESLISSDCSKVSDYSDVSDKQRAGIELLIAKTLPKQQGERNRQLFNFARGLKFDIGLADRPLATLKPIVKQWYLRALPIIGTKAFDDTWTDVVNAFPKAHSPLSGGTLARAIELAGSSPLPQAAAQYDSPPVKALVALCFQLQQMNGASPFYLSSHLAAGFTAVSQQATLKYLNMLVADGVLEVAKRGNQRLATRYRYIAKGDNSSDDASQTSNRPARPESDRP